jgi:hypothetical protein
MDFLSSWWQIRILWCVKIAGFIIPLSPVRKKTGEKFPIQSLTWPPVLLERATATLFPRGKYPEQSIRPALRQGYSDNQRRPNRSPGKRPSASAIPRAIKKPKENQMDDQSILSTVLIIIVPAAILTAIIVWVDAVLQRKESQLQIREHH